MLQSNINKYLNYLRVEVGAGDPNRTGDRLITNPILLRPGAATHQEIQEFPISLAAYKGRASGAFLPYRVKEQVKETAGATR